MSEKAWLNVHANSVEDNLPLAKSTKKKPPTTSQRRALDFRSWAWEAVNAVLLFIMIIATVITLRLHDGQPVPDWPFSITINAMVSTYALVFKGNVALILTSCIGQLQWSWYRSRHVLGDIALFQDAGRSPYGALIWLCKLHLRQPIVSLAALVTILGIAIDPFFQQLAQSASCHTFSANVQKPTIHRTNYFDVSAISSKLNASISSGFYQPPNLSGLGCSTGNCTFDTEYSTLGFCSKCEDISDQIQIEVDCTDDGGENKIWSQDDYRNCTLHEDCPLNSCKITTQAGPSFSATYRNVSAVQNRDPAQRLTTSSEWRTNSDVEYMLWNKGLSLGRDYGMIRAKSSDFVPPTTGCESLQADNTWDCRGYGAAKCFIQPCVRTYTASIDSGQLHERLIESTIDLTWGVSAWVGSDSYPIFGLVDKDCISERERAYLVSDGYKLDGQGRWLAYNFESQSSLSHLLLSKCAYGIDSGFLLPLFLSTLPDILEGQVSQVNSSNGLPPSQDVRGPQQLVYLYDSGNVNMTNINTAFENVAETLTTWIRTNGHQNYSEPAIGQAFHVLTCLHVNWAWLALPAVIALLAFLVLCLTVVMTYRDGLPLWKSSPLALVLHGPGGMDWLDEAMVATPHPKEETANLRTGAGMESMAARIWVSFEDEDAGPRLRQVGMRRKSEP
ncbi:hypothetical protein G7054_g11816 [Neopestalotiopsis clavispora]|nr:hypothetical protein G7054_g11816 [Neopestalotiopsis clavispora]